MKEAANELIVLTYFVDLRKSHSMLLHLRNKYFQVLREINVVNNHQRVN